MAHWERVADKFPEYLPIIVGPLADALSSLGDAAGAAALLKDACEKTRSIDAMEAALTRVNKLEGVAEASGIAMRMLQNRPSLLALNALVQLKHTEHPEDEQMSLLASLLENMQDAFPATSAASAAFWLRTSIGIASDAAAGTAFRRGALKTARRPDRIVTNEGAHQGLPFARAS